MNWEELLNAEPANWNLRFQYAQFFEDAEMYNECVAQRWLADNTKCPGPPCVQEAHDREATWFCAGKEAQKWSFPHFVNLNVINPCWCLPLDIFKRLEGFITVRRDQGFHNQWAKSWNTRAEAEAALVAALPIRKNKYSSIDDRWKKRDW